MKLDDVIAAFERFDFTRAEVLEQMAAGDSAFNAFEGLKLLLQVRFEDMCDEARELLADDYERLQGLKMTARVFGSEREAQKEIERVDSAVDSMLERMNETRKTTGRDMMARIRKRARTEKAAGTLPASVERSLRDAGFFGPDEEI